MRLFRAELRKVTSSKIVCILLIVLLAISFGVTWYSSRPVDNEVISRRVYNSMESEISSKEIGNMVMDALKETDEVAYVRYASVYRSFKDISSFMTELKQMMKSERGERKKK